MCGMNGKSSGDSLFLGDVVDVLTEMYRLDIAIWGDIRTAWVFRCVAVSSLKDGRPIRLNTIALTLNLGLATVHDRLLKLTQWRNPETGEVMALVEGVSQGYILAPGGEQMLSDWLTQLASNARGAIKTDCQTLLSWATHVDDTVEPG